MPDFTIPLLSTTQQTSDVKSFRFDTKGQTISYQAGQFLRLTLTNVINDPRGPSRFFSIASSPTEKDFIMIATKVSESPFKKRLVSLAVGETVTVSGPFGKFTLDEDPTKQHVFLSGGIGITPFRSILKFATDQKLPQKIVLLYSNQTPEDIVFKEDLNQFAKENTNLTIIHTITRPEESKSPWQGRKERIDETLVKEYVKNPTNAIFYICGPPSMVEALNTLVKGMGVSEEHIKTERFTGYQ